MDLALLTYNGWCDIKPNQTNLSELLHWALNYSKRVDTP